MTTTIHVNGAQDSHGVAKAVTDQQKRVNEDLARNLALVVR
jgi:hypothetical protein